MGWKNSCYIENVTFAGEEWNHCIFTFYQRKLLSVDFGMIHGNLSSFESFVSIAKEKYPNGVIKEIANEPKHKLISIQDKIAVMGIGYNETDVDSSGEVILSLVYSDTDLCVQINNARKNDL